MSNQNPFNKYPNNPVVNSLTPVVLNKYPTFGFNLNQTPEYPLIDKTDFRNKHNTLHNNLNPTLLQEGITEYTIFIDSDNRNLDTYPDPFNYVVSFKALGKSVDRHYRRNKQDFDNTAYDETPAPVIIRDFKNVKYVNLHGVILSKFYIKKFMLDQTIEIKQDNASINIKSTEFEKMGNSIPNNHNNNKCHVCNHHCCACGIHDRNKFLILRVKELETLHLFSTNTYSSDNSFILLVDKTIGSAHNTWLPIPKSCVFPDNQLNNIKRLTIEFYDSEGRKLSYGSVVVYNLNVIVGGITTKYTIYAVFGELDNYLSRKIIPTGMLVCHFKFNLASKVKEWFPVIFNQLIATVDASVVDIIRINYDLIYSSIAELKIGDELRNNVTNNLVFDIGVMQSELATQPKYER